MSETMKTIFMFLLLFGVLIVVLRIAGWKMKKAADAIVEDLKKQNALDPASAVELPYSKADLFHLGLRDYRPKALAALVGQDVVRVREDGKYYLRQAPAINISGASAADSEKSHV
ncbi:MAG: hypothetical protein ACYC6Q_10225 [Syntrophales bacterium]